jgi:hypothetical protein
MHCIREINKSDYQSKSCPYSFHTCDNIYREMDSFIIKHFIVECYIFHSKYKLINVKSISQKELFQYYFCLLFMVKYLILRR